MRLYRRRRRNLSSKDGVEFNSKFFYLAKIIKIQSDLEAHRPFVWPFFFSFLPFLNDFFYDRPAWGGGEARI